MYHRRSLCFGNIYVYYKLRKVFEWIAFPISFMQCHNWLSSYLEIPNDVWIVFATWHILLEENIYDFKILLKSWSCYKLVPWECIALLLTYDKKIVNIWNEHCRWVPPDMDSNIQTSITFPITVYLTSTWINVKRHHGIENLSTFFEQQTLSGFCKLIFRCDIGKFEQQIARWYIHYFLSLIRESYS